MTNRLLNSGYEVTALDAFRSKSRINPHSNLIEVKADIYENLDLETLLNQVNNVVFLSSGLTPAAKISSIELHKREAGFRSLLDRCWGANIRRFIFASTGGAMFANSTNEIHDELEEPTPTSQYAEEKLKFERILAEYSDKSEVKEVIIRGSNFYGVPVIYREQHGIIPALLHSAKSGLVFPLIGSIDATRDYLNADDAAKMIVTLIQETPKDNLYNLCSGQGITISKLIEIVEQVSRKKISIRKFDAPNHFVKNSVLNPSRFNSEFGVPSLTPIFVGIQQMWNMPH